MTSQDTSSAVFRPEEAERNILGICLNTPECIGDLSSWGIRPEVFYYPKHRVALYAILALESEGAPIDPVSVEAQMRKDGWTNDNELGLDLFNMTQYAPPVGGASYHAKIVLEGHHRRTAQRIGVQLTQYSQDDTVEISKTVDNALASLETQGDAFQVSKPATVGATMIDALEYYEQRSSTLIMSGYPSLDEMTGGFGGGQTIIVAARPGVGKSTVALDVARNVSKSQGVAMFFSMEMSKREVTARAISAESGVDLKRIMRGTTTDREKDTIAQCMPNLEGMKLFIDDSPGMTVNEIQSKARKQHRSPAGLSLIVVDYIGLITPTQKYENRQVEVSAYSRALKTLALELDIPIIVVAQLNRDAQESDRAKLSDLRESGALEQDADKVIMISRNRDNQDTTVSLAKNRAGELGDVSLVPQLWRARFTDPGPAPR